MSPPLATLAEAALMEFESMTESMTTESLPEYRGAQAADGAYFILRVSADVTTLAVDVGRLVSGRLSCRQTIHGKWPRVVSPPRSLWDPGAGCTPGHPRLYRLDSGANGVWMAGPAGHGSDLLQPTLDTFLLCAALAAFFESRRAAGRPAVRGDAVNAGAGLGLVGKWIAASPGFDGGVTLLDSLPAATAFFCSGRFGRLTTVQGRPVVAVCADAAAYFGAGRPRVALAASNPPYVPTLAEMENGDGSVCGEEGTGPTIGLGLLLFLLRSPPATDSLVLFSSLSLLSTAAAEAVAAAVDTWQGAVVIAREIGFHAPGAMVETDHVDRLAAATGGQYGHFAVSGVTFRVGLEAAPDGRRSHTVYVMHLSRK